MHHAHNKDRTADYHEQQACEANTDNSRAIPLVQLDKHIVTDPLEDILKQIEKQTPMNHTYIKNEQFKNTQKDLIQVTNNKKA